MPPLRSRRLTDRDWVDHQAKVIFMTNKRYTRHDILEYLHKKGFPVTLVLYIYC